MIFLSALIITDIGAANNLMLPPIKCRYLGVQNKVFMEKLDSIISTTRFTPETPIFEFQDENGKYEDYPSNLLSIKKYLQVEIVEIGKTIDSIPKHPYYEGCRLDRVNTQQTTEFYILITGYHGPPFNNYYIQYNRHHYFFNTIIKPDFYRTKKTKEFSQIPEWYYGPHPIWIIKYSDGNMQLIDFHIHYNPE